MRCSQQFKFTGFTYFVRRTRKIHARRRLTHTERINNAFHEVACLNGASQSVLLCVAHNNSNSLASPTSCGARGKFTRAKDQRTPNVPTEYVHWGNVPQRCIAARATVRWSQQFKFTGSTYFMRRTDKNPTRQRSAHTERTDNAFLEVTCPNGASRSLFLCVGHNNVNSLAPPTSCGKRRKIPGANGQRTPNVPTGRSLR